MDKYKPLSPYIEHVLRCARTGRDPNPEAKRYERWQFWDEIIETHAGSIEKAQRMSQNLDALLRQEAKESGSKEGSQEVNQETSATQSEKEG